jgi:hypothetical protein
MATQERANDRRKDRTVLEENVKKLLEACERVDRLGVRL